ncbi:hypothetical protein BD779DRAFT_1677641 [Infundibulicybe gibba]|nr:hypothetical protein BD779DRAFT_1677641 [Infundibulicybe gibba]
MSCTMTFNAPTTFTAAPRVVSGKSVAWWNLATVEQPARPCLERTGSAGSLKRVRTITKTKGRAIAQRRSNSRSSSPCGLNAPAKPLERVRTITKAMGEAILVRRYHAHAVQML